MPPRTNSAINVYFSPAMDLAESFEKPLIFLQEALRERELIPFHWHAGVSGTQKIVPPPSLSLQPERVENMKALESGLY